MYSVSFSPSRVIRDRLYLVEMTKGVISAEAIVLKEEKNRARRY
jgi:hypothetical protein